MRSLENFYDNSLGSTSDQNCNIQAYRINLNDLPNELLIYIFSLVDHESIQAVEGVCERWQALAFAPAVWENMRLVLCMKNYLHIRDNVLPKVSTNLKLVKLQFFKFYKEIRVPLTTLCPNITHLEISISQIGQIIFEDLKQWPNLKFLSFRNSLIMIHANDANLRYMFSIPFCQLKKLETLVLSNFALMTSSLDEMLSCKYLNTLNIEKMKNIPSHFLKSLVKSKLHILKNLCINGDTLNDDIIRLISQSTCLVMLHITTCKSLFDSSLSHLSKLQGLKSLKLRHGYFSTSALIKYFSNNIFQNLTFLSLSRCMHVTLQVAQTIKSNAPRLQELSFYLCPFIMDKTFDRSEIEKLFNFALLLD